MILPIGDSPNPRTVPWVNYALIAVNVVVFVLLLPLSRQRPTWEEARPYAEAIGETAQERLEIARQATRYDLVLFEHGFKPGRPELLDLLTSMFLHGGFAHLAGNLLFLWIFGNNVEHRLGRWGYLFAYLATGLAATLGDALLRPGSPVPAVGASGAISGVLGFYFVWFPQNRVHLWVFLFPFFMDVIELSARVVLIGYVVFSNVLPLVLAGSHSGVAYGAHLGGFVAGTVLALLVRTARPELEPAPWRPPEPKDISGTFKAAVDEARLGEAESLVLQQPRARTRTIPPAEVLRLARSLEEGGRREDALAVYLRVLADHAGGRERVDARLGAARLLLTTQPTLAYQHLAAALEEGPEPDQERELHRLLQDLARWTRSLPRRRWHS